VTVIADTARYTSWSEPTLHRRPVYLSEDNRKSFQQLGPFDIVRSRWCMRTPHADQSWSSLL